MSEKVTVKRSISVMCACDVMMTYNHDVMGKW